MHLHWSRESPPPGPASQWTEGIARPGLSGETTMRLADKVAIVTGGGTGIGAAIATTFAREGARVTITGRRKEILDEVADEIAAAGGHALAVPGSVTDEADVQRAVQATLGTFGRVDVLVNNAGSLF